MLFRSEKLLLERTRDIDPEEPGEYSIMSIPEHSEVTSLRAIFSEFDSEPERILLFPYFEAKPLVAMDIIYNVASKISPLNLSIQVENELHPLRGRSFSYPIGPSMVIEGVSNIIADEVKEQKCFSPVDIIYGRKPQYLSPEEIYSTRGVHLGSLALIRHYEDAGREISAIVPLLKPNEKAA